MLNRLDNLKHLNKLDNFKHLNKLKENNYYMCMFILFLIDHNIVDDFFPLYDLTNKLYKAEYYLSKYSIVLHFNEYNILKIYKMDNNDDFIKISNQQFIELLLTIPSIKEKIPYYLDLF